MAASIVTFATACDAYCERKLYIYLVDPLGNLMMRYPRDPDPAKLLKDLQRLLRYSRIG